MLLCFRGGWPLLKNLPLFWKQLYPHASFSLPVLVPLLDLPLPPCAAPALALPPPYYFFFAGADARGFLERRESCCSLFQPGIWASSSIFSLAPPPTSGTALPTTLASSSCRWIPLFHSAIDLIFPSFPLHPLFCLSRLSLASSKKEKFFPRFPPEAFFPCRSAFLPPESRT